MQGDLDAVPPLPSCDESVQCDMMCISKSICGYLQKKPTGHLAPISCPFPSGQKRPAHSMIFQYKHASRAYPARIEMCTLKGNDKMVVLMSLAHASQAQSENLPSGSSTHQVGQRTATATRCHPRRRIQQNTIVPFRMSSPQDMRTQGHSRK